MYHWAPAQAKATEVDFLLKRGQKILAIEVESKMRFSRSMLSGLGAIEGLANLEKRVLVYGGRRVLQTEDGIYFWPVEKLVSALTNNDRWR
jgi:predicted AAA+ superfamily ATPase